MMTLQIETFYTITESLRKLRSNAQVRAYFSNFIDKTHLIINERDVLLLHVRAEHQYLSI